MRPARSSSGRPKDSLSSVVNAWALCAVHVILPLTTWRSVTQRVCSILGTDVDMVKASGRSLDHIAAAALELPSRRAAEPLNALRSQCAVTAVESLMSSRCCSGRQGVAPTSKTLWQPNPTAAPEVQTEPGIGVSVTYARLSSRSVHDLVHVGTCITTTSGGTEYRPLLIGIHLP